MENAIIIFLIGVVAGFLIESIILLIYNFLYLKFKYRVFTGNFIHDYGPIKIIHEYGNIFTAYCKENEEKYWVSRLEFNGINTFTGIYEWNYHPNAWGEHFLKTTPYGNVTAKWFHKASDKPSQGTVQWKRVNYLSWKEQFVLIYYYFFIKSLKYNDAKRTNKILNSIKLE